MIKRKWFSLGLTVAVTMAFATTASAISLDFISVPSGGTEHIGPYRLLITGDVAITSPPAPFTLKALPSNKIILGVCNDISGAAPGFGEGGAWQVQKHGLFDSSVANSGSLQKGAGATVANPSTKAKFIGASSPFENADLTDYKAGAYLAQKLLSLAPIAATLPARTNLQKALWGLFNHAYLLNGTQTQLVTDAYTAAANPTWTGWQSFAVYTRVPLDGPPRGTQEFYVKVPEAVAFASLGLYFGSLGLLGYAFRRRMKLTN